LLLFTLGLAVARVVLHHCKLAAFIDLGRGGRLLGSEEGTAVLLLLTVSDFLGLVYDFLGSSLEFFVFVCFFDDFRVRRMVLATALSRFKLNRDLRNF
jgi:hypothetical protein